MADAEKILEENEEDEDLAEYDDDDVVANSSNSKGNPAPQKGSYAGIHSTGFRDFLLKPELQNAISACGFEHPSEVQQECIPQAMLGNDIICQAKSGMGKTAVFVLSTLQQIEPVAGQVDTLVMCHTRELAYQICQEFQRFTKFLPEINVRVFFGGIPYQEHVSLLEKGGQPHIVVGTPGRLKKLIQSNKLKVDKLKRFILDECDEMLKQLDMRRDVQQIFRQTAREKQVMMFSATLSKEVRPVCRKFTRNPSEIYVDDESKLTLYGLQQYYVKLEEKQKNRKLNDLLDALEFNQVVIFVSKVQRCKELNKLLVECNFPSICIYGGLNQTERLDRYNKFKEFKARILVATDLFGRGVDFERVNIVVNYDMPRDGEKGKPTEGKTGADQYLHRVGRSGRFGTKGLAISFVSSKEDAEVLDLVQSRFEVEIPVLPETIDVSTYMS